ncbi:ABC transporter ATP-binding protein [Anaerofustis stercorihominis]|uniref:ABC-type quaternary amine transporter n=1 Tax=Anaerofustis stercorihominis DSM 17244 TaxID=445971 RepID=B1CA97_9FIRM|nr:ABC transporter ATP-binding protein [Anaerofustis stercorihominis]EDS72608.1 ABC transporter, ATP-binding protein [Anaerofustis stercorihominis DSM 17244]MCQ4795053.1 ABC transporter ATP-binding protein [Anaerofustis stercorihominis]
MSNIIEFKNVSKTYDDNTVLKDFNLNIEKGEFLTVIGTSGSGKTTMLKMINSLIEPSGGDIFVNGINNKDVDKIKLRRNIGYAIQGSVLFPNMNVEKNIAYVPNLLNKKDKERTKKAVAKWMDIVGLEDSFRERYPDELSGGEAQRVSIARSLAASPEILLMDEPFGAVDEITRMKLQDEILKVYNKTDITIVFITHDIKEAFKLGTKILIMDKGKIEQYGTKEEILNNPGSEFVKNLIKSVM